MHDLRAHRRANNCPHTIPNESPKLCAHRQANKCPHAVPNESPKLRTLSLAVDVASTDTSPEPCAVACPDRSPYRRSELRPEPGAVVSPDLSPERDPDVTPCVRIAFILSMIVVLSQVASDERTDAAAHNGRPHDGAAHGARALRARNFCRRSTRAARLKIPLRHAPAAQTHSDAQSSSRGCP